MSERLSTSRIMNHASSQFYAHMSKLWIGGRPSFLAHLHNLMHNDSGEYNGKEVT